MVNLVLILQIPAGCSFVKVIERPMGHKSESKNVVFCANNGKLLTDTHSHTA